MSFEEYWFGGLFYQWWWDYKPDKWHATSVNNCRRFRLRPRPMLWGPDQNLPQDHLGLVPLASVNIITASCDVKNSSLNCNTWFENLEMSWNWLQFGELLGKILSEKLFTATFMFGAIPLFSRLSQAAWCNAYFKDFAAYVIILNNFLKCAPTCIVY